MRSGDQVRSAFLSFFAERGHQIVPSSSLAPIGDPTLLLTSAGMVQMKPYFIGEATPPSRRLTSAQKCFRATDIDKVGDERHLTFFEMLGNFSVGDYFKEGAIEFAWDLSTKVFDISPDRIWITIYPDDSEAERLWRKIANIKPERIAPSEENWWGAGDTGPCGPDSELYFDRGKEWGCGRPSCGPGCECARYLEYWNLVFMQYDKAADGSLTPLPSQNIDTGAGLERLTMLLNGLPTVYETDLFRPVIEKSAGLAGVHYGASDKTDYSLRVVADHSRAATFLIADGVLPSNEGRGYVLRRVLRRAARYGRSLGIEGNFLGDTANVVINMMGKAYPELAERRDFISQVINYEEKRFGQTLAHGIIALEELIEQARQRGENVLPGEEAFRLHDTFGFPKELTIELAAEAGLKVDEAGFDKAMGRQREAARSAAKFGLGDQSSRVALISLGTKVEFVGYDLNETRSRVVAILAGMTQIKRAESGQIVDIVLDKTPFYAEAGGQVGDTGLILGKIGRAEVMDTQRPAPDLIVHRAQVVEGELAEGDGVTAKIDVERREQIRRHHTATHLLHKALRETLGAHVHQAGSLVAPERLRFDFTHLSPMTIEQTRQIEEAINQQIRRNLEVRTSPTTYQEAVKAGAMALFGEKYGDEVRMLEINDYSRELCGGTHVRRTGDIGAFHLVSESAVGAGLRRIEAVAGEIADQYVRSQLDMLAQITQKLGGQPLTRLLNIEQELASLKRELQKARREQAGNQVGELIAQAKSVNGLKVLAARVDADSFEGMRELGDLLRNRLEKGVLVLGGPVDSRPGFVAMVSPGVNIHAGRLVGEVAAIAGGKGGGRPDIAQAGGGDLARIDEALAKVPEIVEKMLDLS